MNTTENIVSAIEDSLVDYLKIVAGNGNRPFVYDNKIGWVRTYPTVGGSLTVTFWI